MITKLMKSLPPTFVNVTPDVVIRQSVANDPNTPPEVLTQLACDDDMVVRQSVASNPHTPPETLTKLSTDIDGWVRHGVAGNPSTPPETLVQLDALEAAYQVTES